MNAHLAESPPPADRLPPHATFLPVSFAHQGHRLDGSPVSWRVEAFLHGGAYLAAERRVVDFTNYQADLGDFPTPFPPHANPHPRLPGGPELPTPPPDFPR